MDVQPGLAWLVAGMVLLVAEVFCPGAFMMWLGLAALGTGAATLLWNVAFANEVVVFAALAAASIGLALWVRRGRQPRINQPSAFLVGRRARALAFEGREGRVRLGDSDWSARLAPGMPIPAADAALVVLGVEGTVLVVGPPPAP